MFNRKHIPFIALFGWLGVAAADEPNGTVQGMVIDSASHPVSGATVVLSTRRAGAKNVAATHTNEKGAFRFVKLPAGAYDVLAVYGDQSTLMKDIGVGGDETVEVLPYLPVTPEVIDIHERIKPPKPPQVIKSSTKKVLPWSDEAIDKDVWAVGWMLLQIDAAGKVTSFQFLNRPAHDLDKIATAQIWKLRFTPATDVSGRAVSSQLLWRMEWPGYWWWQKHYMAPTPGFVPPSESEVMEVGRWRPGPLGQYVERQNLGFLLPSNSMVFSPRLPPCRQEGRPLNLGSSYHSYRDCPAPALEQAETAEVIQRPN